MMRRIFLLCFALSLTLISACKKQNPSQDSAPAAVEIVEEEEQDLTEAELDVSETSEAESPSELKPELQEIQPEAESSELQPAPEYADRTRMISPSDTPSPTQIRLNVQAHLIGSLMAQLQAMLNVDDQKTQHSKIRKIIYSLGHLKARQAAPILAQAYNKKGLPVEIRLSAAGALIKMELPSSEHVIKKGFFRIRQFVMNSYLEESHDFIYAIMGGNDPQTNALFEGVLAKIIGSHPDCSVVLEK